MLPVEVIARKRDGGTLSAETIREFLTAYAADRIPDYQMSALAMAVYLRGMDDAETAAFTETIRESGRTLQWAASAPPCVDKHSTGGIGDKVSLVLGPLLAACDVWVPMLSGRGLGATGGTLDKLEAIPGFCTQFSLDEVQRLVERVGCAIVGTTPEIAPIDRRLYALRDVTATVASIPLITASIMGKKLAEGLAALVLDVKWGNGAFIKSQAEARILAQKMVATGQRAGVATTAFLTDMNQPLGRLAGNTVEVEESIAALQNGGPADLRELVLLQGSAVLVSAGVAADHSIARKRLEERLASGLAFERFEAMVTAQGGDLRKPRPIAAAHELTAPQAGFIAAVDTEALGLAIVEMGGGRRQLGDIIDPSVGLEWLVRIGDPVDRGQPWLRGFAPVARWEAVRPRLERALTISDHPVPPLPLVIEHLTEG